VLEDIQAVALPILRHRIIVNHRAVGDSVTSTDLINSLLKTIQ
jgi:MoxR-like ATPase